MMNQAAKPIELKDADTDIQDLGLKQDELEMLEIYRKAKRLKFADIAVTVQEGVRVKLWLTEKRK